ncbi:MAG: SAM-dependent methyltransferase [Verrucomicrobiota bacterium]|jgi:SAM-dependent MidA family methyltransferase
MNRLALLIQEEIRRDGPISFARFMELALYAPGLGYYERQREIGRRGDFFTSVSVGPLLGELLGFQFAQWLGRDGAPNRLHIVEAGAHQGALAADILGWLRKWRPDLLARLEYCLVEASPARRAWQEQTLRDWLPLVKWVSDIAEACPEPGSRIIFCNEFLDAMPVHRLVWDAAGKKWEECVVACEKGAFVSRQAPPPPELAEGLPRIAPELAAVLPPGFVLEHSPAAVAWWKKAAATLARGKLLTIDYGLAEQERLRPERSGGTLRTFARHHAGGGLLDNPGECDITAHIDFCAIEEAGRAAGLATEGLMEQGQFLTKILAQTLAEPGGFEAWTPARTRQFQTLTHPDHLGRAFRVLIQSAK